MRSSRLLSGALMHALAAALAQSQPVKLTHDAPPPPPKPKADPPPKQQRMAGTTFTDRRKAERAQHRAIRKGRR